MRSNAPTRKQHAVLEFLKETQRRVGCPPTLEEIKTHFGFRSLTSVTNNLEALERKGLILRERGARGIRFPDGHDAEDGFRLPLLGATAAGMPDGAIPWSDEYIVIGKNTFPRPEELFAVRVNGDSMIGAAILDEDLLIVRKTHEAKDGAIVIARIGDEVTVKRFVREGDKAYLHPENTKYNDIHFESWQHVELEGVVVGVLRDVI